MRLIIRTCVGLLPLSANASSRRDEGTVCAAHQHGMDETYCDSTRRPLPENFAGFARDIIHLVQQFQQLRLQIFFFSTAT